MKTVTASGIFSSRLTRTLHVDVEYPVRSRPRARLLVPTATLAQHLQNQLAREGCALLSARVSGGDFKGTKFDGTKFIGPRFV